MPMTYVGGDLMSFSDDGWTPIEVIVDSGACETVMPRNMCSRINIVPSRQSGAGVEYEVASGVAIPNLGERRCDIFAEGGLSSMLMHFQVADVHQPLLSLSRCADMGFNSFLNSEGGYIQCSQTGEQIAIHRRGNLYITIMLGENGASGGDAAD